MVKRVAGNVTSYDTGNQPFKHDVGRGKWSSKWDFYAIMFSNCFGLRHYMLYYFLARANPILMLISYTIGMFVFTIPLYFIQIFLGQFSSTGFISALRIAPLFKGLGYVSLVMNLLAISYFMVTAAFPLLIVFESMQPYLPWENCTNHFNTEQCHYMQPGVVNTSADYFEIFDFMEDKSFPIHEYLDYILNSKGDNDFYVIWQIVLCMFLIWGLVGLLVFLGVELIGKVFKVTTVVLLSARILVTFRLLFVSETWEIMNKIFAIQFISWDHLSILIASPLLAFANFGSGWGNILTVASYNNFREDIGKLTMITCIGQMIIFFINILNFIAVERFLHKHYMWSYINYTHGEGMTFVFTVFAFYFTHLGWSHLWTILYFGSTFLAQFSDGVIQFLSIMTAILDEYEYMRIYRTFIIGGLTVAFSFISIFFCTTSGLESLYHLFGISSFSKLLILFLELMVIVWVYGRLRLQRDIQFMLGKPIHSWKVWMMRFATPIFIGFCMLIYLFENIFFIRSRYIVITMVFLLLKMLPILWIPSYMFYKVFLSTGDIFYRLKRLCRPTDWHPADPIEHQKYEEYLGNSEIADELITDGVHVNMETEIVDL